VEKKISVGIRMITIKYALQKASQNDQKTRISNMGCKKTSQNDHKIPVYSNIRFLKKP
jgi:hypothetical protein